MKGVINNLNKS